jgi:hypothetical protein
MRFVLFSLLILFGNFGLSAQTNVSNTHTSTTIPDARLYAAFDSSYLQTILQANPTLIRRWNFYLDNAFIITDFPSKKGNINDLKIVQIPNVSNFNIFVIEKTQKLGRDWEKPVFYRINQTDKVLMYFSGKDFMKKFNQSTSF